MKNLLNTVITIVIIIVFMLAIFTVAIPVFLSTAVFVGAALTRTSVGAYDSPTGEYSIRTYWIDLGAMGYAGETYLVKKGRFQDKIYFLWAGPTGCEWISDDEFELFVPWHTKKQRFHVDDFIKYNHWYWRPRRLVDL